MAAADLCLVRPIRKMMIDPKLRGIHGARPVLPHRPAGFGRPGRRRPLFRHHRRRRGVEFRYHFPEWPETVRGRDALMALYAGYGNNIVLHAADELVVHRSQDPRVVIIEYDVHGKIVATGSSYDNRFISVVTIEGRKIVQWRDYMDSLAAMTALSQVQ